ncbi:GNAT family N-acetyltransferase [Dokdonella sp.]|uniref:GNAT family N-acetyltransferase n=1 Tax=Dokdonella sp. TaxID=2291710 RepID=UPI002F430029
MKGDIGMHRLLIRRGVRADAPALAEFAARSFADTFGAANDPLRLQAFLETTYGVAQQSRELADPDTAILLATDGGDLVAYAQVCRGEPPACVDAPDAVELQRFYVDRAAHGSGVAQRLMQAVRDIAREFGAHALWLGVWEHNPRAIAFYAKCGYTDVGCKTFDLGGDRQTDRVMLLRLDRAGAPRGRG